MEAGRIIQKEVSSADSQISRLPPFLRVLRNPFWIVLATWVMYMTVGVWILGSPMSFLLLERKLFDEAYLYETLFGLVANPGCGLFRGWQDMDAILCRLFFPWETFIPFMKMAGAMALLVWAFQCARRERFVWLLTKHQRRFLVLAIFSVQFFIFARGFWWTLALPSRDWDKNPFVGDVWYGCGLFSIVAFWAVVERFETAHLRFQDKGS